MATAATMTAMKIFFASAFLILSSSSAYDTFPYYYYSSSSSLARRRSSTTITKLRLRMVMDSSPQTILFTTITTSRSSSSSSVSSNTSLRMVPRYDTESQMWYATDPETEGPSAGYNLLGSLYRAGPVPVVQRLFNPISYEQAVLKYMAREQCSRIEAMGNMDAYLENPQDWTYQKMCEREKGAARKDYAYANMNPKQIVLSTVWAGVVVVFGYDLITGVIDGRYGPVEGSTNDLFHGNLWNLPF